MHAEYNSKRALVYQNLPLELTETARAMPTAAGHACGSTGFGGPVAQLHLLGTEKEVVL